MNKIFLPLLSLMLLTLVSCSKGLSDSTAIEIAESAPGFSTTECMLLRIHSFPAATKGSSHIVDGVVVRERDQSNEKIHSHTPTSKSFIPTVLTESDGRIVNVLGNPYTLAFLHRFGGACSGCEYCLEKFAEKGLLTFKWVNGREEDQDAKDFGFRRCDVNLTEEGKKYVVEWDDDCRQGGTDLLASALNANTGDDVAVKLMQRVYTRAEKITQTESTGEYNLYYYNEMTPFGEVIFGPTDKNKEYKCTVTYYKNLDGEWKASTVKDDDPNAEKREL